MSYITFLLTFRHLIKAAPWVRNEAASEWPKSDAAESHEVCLGDQGNHPKNRAIVVDTRGWISTALSLAFGRSVARLTAWPVEIALSRRLSIICHLQTMVVN